MSGKGNALSRDPNMCASCSSILDGMEDARSEDVLSVKEPANFSVDNRATAGVSFDV